MFGDVSDLPLLELTTLFFTLGHKFVEVFFDVFKNEVGFIYYSHDLFEFDDVGVVHLAQSLDF